MALPFANDGSFFEQFQKLKDEKIASQPQQPAEPQEPAQPQAAQSEPAVTESPETAVKASAPETHTELHPEPTAAEPSTSGQPPAESERLAFLPTAQFHGAKVGYVFKLGEEGQGYYADEKKAGLWPKVVPKPQLVDPKKGLVLKSGKPIANIKLRAAAPIAKRQKTDGNEEKPAYLQEMDKYRQQSCTSDTTHDRPLVK